MLQENTTYNEKTNQSISKTVIDIRISRQRHEISMLYIQNVHKVRDWEDVTKDPKCTFIDEDYNVEIKIFWIGTGHASAHL